MKKGYSVDNICYIKDADCIIIKNYESINLIANYWYNFNILKDIINDNSIGVWKIKNKN